MSHTLGPASTSTDSTVTYDTTGPTVTVEQGSAGGTCAVNQPDPTLTLAICYDVVFNEAIDATTFTQQISVSLEQQQEYQVMSLQIVAMIRISK